MSLSLGGVRLGYRVGVVLAWVAFGAGWRGQAWAQDALPAAAVVPAAAAALQGGGLAQRDFFYAGEQKSRNMYIVRKGQVVWSYLDADGRGEISDATVLSNGNILYAHQFGVTEITPDKKVVWNYDAPPGTETHTAVPIGNDRVLFIQNGDPALLKVVNIRTEATEKQLELPVGNPKSVHGQFRHARLTAKGTLMVAHMDMGKVSEYDSDGKEVWSFPADGPWGVSPLANGNVLITDRIGVREVTHRGDTVWSWTRADAPDYKVTNLQLAWRLANGDTLINNWENVWNGPVNLANAPIQAIEVAPDKKVVWGLRSWTEPADLGPATTIQVLDDPAVPEDVHFGSIH